MQIKLYKLAILSSLFIFSQNKAFAKTEGTYAGVDLLTSNVTHQYQRDGSVTPINFYADKFDNRATGFGLNYKVAYNKNNFFLAPEFFYDYLGNKATDMDPSRSHITLTSRFGAKINLGYDFTDKFAAYANIGAASNNYKVDWHRAEESRNKNSLIFGLGALYHFNDRVTFNAEYNYSQMQFRTPVSSLIDHDRVKVEVIKIGIAYHF